jgi:4'-phosphopantetheinyl transferase
MLDNEVQVWYARLDLPSAALRQLYETLAPSEKSKAARFKFHVDCRRFIARRGILRCLLAKYAQMAPAKVEMLSTERGKLQIAPHQSSRIRFNLSHSRGLSVYAFTLDRDVGVDIECIDQSMAWGSISRAFFTGCEQNVISRLPASRKSEAFFEIWTRKESILKADGRGLQFDPARIHVAEDYSPGRPTVLYHNDCLWKLVSLSANGFATTLAAAGVDWRMQQNHWPPE